MWLVSHKLCEDFRKLYKVLIINENKFPGNQNESTAKIYMNRFSIEEDQFEIHVKDFTDKYFIDGKDIYNVAEEVFLNEEVVQQGLVFCLLSVYPKIQMIWKINLEKIFDPFKTTVSFAKFISL